MTVETTTPSLEVTGNNHPDDYYDALSALAANHRGSLAVEIGVDRGRSLLCLAPYFSLVVGLDIFEQQPIEVVQTLLKKYSVRNVLPLKTTNVALLDSFRNIDLLHLDLGDEQSNRFTYNQWKDKARIIVTPQKLEGFTDEGAFFVRFNDESFFNGMSNS